MSTRISVRERRDQPSRGHGLRASQLCYIEDALQLMEDRAAVQGMTLKEVAAGVLDRSIQFGN
jgi:hypothetical protein